MKKISVKVPLSAEKLKEKMNIKNGVDGVNGLDGKNGLDGHNGSDGSPDTGEQIISKVNESESQIDRERVRGLDELEKGFAEQISSIPRGGGSRGFQLQVDGAKKGLAQFMNIKSGANIVVSDSIVNGLHTITITGSGGGGNIEQPVGMIDGSNRVFTVSNTPKWIVVDGGTTLYPSDSVTGLSYTYSAGTITVNTERAPTVSIKSFY